jgi:hypothetical protein
MYNILLKFIFHLYDRLHQVFRLLLEFLILKVLELMVDEPLWLLSYPGDRFLPVWQPDNHTC